MHVCTALLRMQLHLKSLLKVTWQIYNACGTKTTLRMAMPYEWQQPKWNMQGDYGHKWIWHCHALLWEWAAFSNLHNRSGLSMGAKNWTVNNCSHGNQGKKDNRRKSIRCLHDAFVVSFSYVEDAKVLFSFKRQCLKENYTFFYTVAILAETFCMTLRKGTSSFVVFFLCWTDQQYPLGGINLSLRCHQSLGSQSGEWPTVSF